MHSGEASCNKLQLAGVQNTRVKRAQQALNTPQITHPDNQPTRHSYYLVFRGSFVPAPSRARLCQPPSSTPLSPTSSPVGRRCAGVTMQWHDVHMQEAHKGTRVSGNKAQECVTLQLLTPPFPCKPT